MIRAALFALVTGLAWAQVDAWAGFAAASTGIAAALLGWINARERREA